MLAAVRHSRPVPDQASFRYTFSAGLAWAESGEEPSDIYRRADLALYAAKMRGRDQLSIEIQPRRHLGEARTEQG